MRLPMQIEGKKHPDGAFIRDINYAQRVTDAELTFQDHDVDLPTSWTESKTVRATRDVLISSLLAAVPGGYKLDVDP